MGEYCWLEIELCQSHDLRIRSVRCNQRDGVSVDWTGLVISSGWAHLRRRSVLREQLRPLHSPRLPDVQRWRPVV